MMQGAFALKTAAQVHREMMTRMPRSNETIKCNFKQFTHLITEIIIT